MKSGKNIKYSLRLVDCSAEIRTGLLQKKTEALRHEPVLSLYCNFIVSATSCYCTGLLLFIFSY